MSPWDKMAHFDEDEAAACINNPSTVEKIPPAVTAASGPGLHWEAPPDRGSLARSC